MIFVLHSPLCTLKSLKMWKPSSSHPTVIGTILHNKHYFSRFLFKYHSARFYTVFTESFMTVKTFLNLLLRKQFEAKVTFIYLLHCCYFFFFFSSELSVCTLHLFYTTSSIIGPRLLQSLCKIFCLV
jgi:hypothetical protein